MYCVYILRSLRDGKLYIGQTQNINQRIEEHKRGKNLSTRNRRPFELVHKEEHSIRLEAIKRERQLKKYKSSTFIKKLIDVPIV